ncbi:MAG: GNAT family N-acetyltransferase [Alphaproteobacteria bacterium]|nr:GNAT family N-acetyltransferase [Alphaproteobacteria bacterium]
MTVRLRPLREADLRPLYDWQRDPALYDHLVGTQRDVTWDEARAWMIRHWIPQDRDRRYALCPADSGEIVGAVYLLAVDGAQQALAFHIFIGDRTQRARGLGRAALQEALHIAFDDLGAEEIRLEVLASNDRARRIYDDAGFIETGRRLVDKRSGPVEAVAMALSRDAYRAR